ncbi:MAG: hypothetical protein ABI467_09610, partial [Kofleriaceae bacterium]
MRFIVIVLCLSACTKHNTDSCCTTADQCLSLGLSEMYGCDAGKTCDMDGTCVPTECSTSADCTSPDAPICENQLCIAHCVGDAECDGTPGRAFCSSDGACVACTMDDQCSADVPVCDTTARSCRTCAQDSECASGVCLEDLGTCADASRLIFVASAMPDTGECTNAAPCGTLTYALSKMTTLRDIIHINTATLSPAPVTLDGHSGRIDGSSTLLTRGDAGNVISMASGQMTLTGLRIGSGIGTIIPLTVSGGHIETYGVEFLGSVTSTGGTIEILSSTLDSGVNCSAGGHLSIDRTVLEGGYFINQCQLDLTSSRMENGAFLSAISATLHVSNNLILSSNGDTDPANLGSVPGSYFIFNTMVNVGPANSATALNCDSTLDARDNIIAWNTINQPSCETQYTLFDSAV